MLRLRPTSFVAVACGLHVLSVFAYVPATPSNDTSFIGNSTDFIQINWLPLGVSAYKDALSRQLVYTPPQQVGGVAGYRVRKARSISSGNASS